MDIAKYIGKLSDGFSALRQSANQPGGASGDKAGGRQKRDAAISESSSSMIKALLGSSSQLEDFYFPPDLIGGTCPRIVGEEEEIVWNAAAEACDSERVHVVWQSFENRIWYLAVRSSDLASHADSWCPLASLLPTMKDAATPPACYTYFSDEVAVMMVVATDGLQIIRGTPPIVRAKAERTARELGNAPIIYLDPDKIAELNPIPWYSLSMFEDRARRVLATLGVFSALFVLGLSFLVWMTASMSLLAAKHGILPRSTAFMLE